MLYPISVSDATTATATDSLSVTTYTPVVTPLNVSDVLSLSIIDSLAQPTSYTPTVYPVAFSDGFLLSFNDNPNTAGGAFTIGYFRTTPLHSWVVTVAKRLWAIAAQSVGARNWSIAPVIRKWTVTQ